VFLRYGICKFEQRLVAGSHTVSLTWDLVLFNRGRNPVVTLMVLITMPWWDFGFQVIYKVILDANSLSSELKITNIGKKPDVVTFPRFVDCIYLGAPNELRLDDGSGSVIHSERVKTSFHAFQLVSPRCPKHLLQIFFTLLSLYLNSWSDAVLWNLHLQMEACYK
ncbi:hypothetical protein Tsubulata_008788, partial [Turnera subulata]